MNVFLDSNIFYGNWWLASAPFRSLVHFLNNENHTFLISRLVLQEVANTRRKELEAARAERNKTSLAVAKLIGKEWRDDALQVEDPHYDLLALLNERLDNVTVVDFAGIEQQRVVDRALAVRRPFQASEKGYRDTPIWLSLLDHLDANQGLGATAFITRNVSDFFQGKEGCEWHAELLRDLKNIGLEGPKPYRSLESFLKENVDTDDHAVDKTRLLDEVEHDLELSAEAEFSVKSSVAGRALETHAFGDLAGLALVVDLRADVIEGIEDFDVISTSSLKGNEAYVECSFNLRMVMFELVVSRRFVDIHRQELDRRALGASMILFDEDFVIVRAIGRPYFDASFVYDTESGDFSGFTGF